jgi:tetratricopeptide (TPR) repeat protein
MRALLSVGALAAVVSMAGCGSVSAPSQAGGAHPTPAPTASRLPPSPLPAAVRESPTVAEIARLSALVKAYPSDADSQRALGFALTQRVRETADPSLYAPALAAFDAALVAQPDDALALTGIAGIQLGKHEFASALGTAEVAVDLSPSLVPAHAARLDALVELGRYKEAETAAGELLGLSVDITTLTRVSYVAELHGHLPEALAAIRLAADSPGLAPENTAFAEALLGNLLVYDGDLAGAQAAYATALSVVPDHAPSIAGQGRLAVAAGRLDDAVALFERAAAIVPLPEFVIALGDAQTAAGDPVAAARSYDLARAEIQLFESAGVIVDVDLAIFEADHGDPEAALAHAKAAFASTPTVRSADAMAWALHRLDRDKEAAEYAARALRLGSIDPVLRYHAGAIEAALGDVDAARRDLEMALATDPGFSAVGAAEARRLLDSLR